MRYGVGVAFVEDLYQSQAGRCAICNEPGEQPSITEKRASFVGVLCIDHDHETGRVRGLLCRGCNLALGYLKDNVATIERAADYISRKGVR